MKNEIIDEVRAARAALTAEHGYDRQRVFEWAKAAHAARQKAKAASPGKAVAKGKTSHKDLKSKKPRALTSL